MTRGEREGGGAVVLRVGTVSTRVHDFTIDLVLASCHSLMLPEHLEYSTMTL